MKSQQQNNSTPINKYYQLSAKWTENFNLLAQPLLIQNLNPNLNTHGPLLYKHLSFVKPLHVQNYFSPSICSEDPSRAQCMQTSLCKWIFLSANLFKMINDIEDWFFTEKNVTLVN